MATINNRDVSTLTPSTAPSTSTETERAFGLAGEDTAMSLDEYYAEKRKRVKSENEAMLQAYLSGDGASDGFKYDEEYLRSLEPNRLVDILYEEDRDLVERYTDPNSTPAKEREFKLKTVPKAVAPYVRVVAKGAGYVVVRPISEVEPEVADSITQLMEMAREQETIEATSKGAEARPYTPSMRDRHAAGLAGIFKKTGLAKDNYNAYRLARDIVGDPTEDDILESLGIADLSPVGALYAVDEAGTEMGKLSQQDADAVDYIAPSAVLGLSLLEAFPVTKGLAKGGKRFLTGRGASRTKTADEVITEVEADIATGEAAQNSARATDKYDIGRVKKETKAREAERKKAARQKAAENDDIMEDLIDAYEETHKVDIHSVIDGKKVIDYQKARQVGISRLQDMGLDDDTVSTLGFGPDGYRMPIFDPDKLDSFIAVIAELKQSNPDIFKNVKKPRKKIKVKTEDGRTIVGKEEGRPEPKGLNIIEALFEASVKGDFDLIKSKEFNDALDKYGLGIDDFIQQLVGSGSYYGKGLNRIKQIADAMRRGKTPTELDQEAVEKSIEKVGGFKKGVRRFENIVRGSMVGTIATAMRNFESFIIRAPLEGMTNLFTNAIHATATGKFDKFITENPFKRSFQIYGEMFRDRTGIREYADFILEDPKFADQLTRFYNQVNEIQTGLGRGQADTKVGKGFDYVLTKLEDGVSVVNAPNRMQEFFARRTVFMDKLQQLVKREYDIELVDAMNSGLIKDLMRNNPNVIGGTNKRKFEELVADAVDSALDVTYAASPKFGLFKYLLRGLNSTTGSTFIIPFPRFMFKSLEYMTETTAGLPIAVTRRMMGLGEEGGRFVTSQGKATYNTEMAARGMAGWAAIGTTYMAAEAGLIDDNNRIRIPGTNKVVDVTTQFPLAQLAYLGKGMQKMMSSEKDFFEWFDGRTFVQLFSGTNFRANTGLGGLIDDTFEMAAGEAKLGNTEALANSAGKFFGELTTRIAQPYQMVIDVERGLGIRDTTIRDYSADPDMTIGGSFSQGFMETIQRRGYTTQEGGFTGFVGEALGMGMSATYENAEGDRVTLDIDEPAPEGYKLVEKDREAPIKQYATKPGGKDRILPLVKFATGITIMEEGTDEQEFFRKYGFNDWDFSSRTGVGTVDNAVNETLSGLLPSLAQNFMNIEERFKEQGKSDKFIKTELKARIKQATMNLKKKIYRHGLRVKGADDPAFIRELFGLRRYNAETQRAIVNRFESIEGREPDLTSTKDLRKLNTIAKRGRYKGNIL